MPTGILSPTHLLVVLVVALIVLGPKKLPGAGRALGQSLREFKDSIGGNGAGASEHRVAGLLAGSDVAIAHEPARVTAAASHSHDSAPLATGELA